MNKIFAKNARPKRTRFARNDVIRLCTILFLASAVLITSGCEPLRKKFTRKKKGEVQTTAIALLDPIDYPDKIKSAAELYKERYNLWKIWHSDLLMTIDDNRGDKKALYDLAQMQEQLNAMKKLLTEDKQKIMAEYLDSLQQIENEFQKPASFRNKVVLSSQVSSLGRNVRHHFAPDKITSSLTTEPQRTEN